MNSSGSSYRYLLAFGSNLGDKSHNFLRALSLLEGCLRISRKTKWIETKPLLHSVYDTSDHDNYLNFVCEAISDLPPHDLYKIVYQVENIIGHPRDRRWQPRQLDIDILFCVKNDAPDFHKCTPYPYSDNIQFYVPHKEYFNRYFWRDSVENELRIPSSFLHKHLN